MSRAMVQFLPESRRRFLAHALSIACSNRDPVVKALRYLLISKSYLLASRHYNIFRFSVIEIHTNLYALSAEIDNKSTDHLKLPYFSALRFLQYFRPRILSIGYSLTPRERTLTNARDFMELAQKIHLDIRLVDGNRFLPLIQAFPAKIRALNCDPAFLAGMDVLPAMRLDVFCILVRELASADQLNAILRHVIKHLVLDFNFRRLDFTVPTESRAHRRIDHLEIRGARLATRHDDVDNLITFFGESRPKMFTLQLHASEDFRQITPADLVDSIRAKYLSIDDLKQRCQQIFTRFSIRLDLVYNFRRGTQLNNDLIAELARRDPFKNLLVRRDTENPHRISMIEYDERSTLQINIKLFLD